MAEPYLPDDILHLLCEELAAQEQFDTLFNCACSSRILAVPALTHLYRSHHQAPVRGGGDDFYGLPAATKLLMLQRWSILWRSIIASSLGASLFPYCRYIKSLDFRDLGNLLDDDQFRLKVSKQFFSGPLKQFEKSETRTNIKGKKYTRLNNADIIDAIGEVVTLHTPTLESISGELLSGPLVRWTPRLPRLTTLELWDGKPLEDERLHIALRDNCPQFSSLMIYTWRSDDTDHSFATFLSAMRPNSLKTLHAISDIRVGADTFLALNHHGQSLEDLQLSVTNETLPHLSLLQGCTALNNLRIDDTHEADDLETSQHEAFLETVAWLRKCESLRSLEFFNCQSGAALVTPVLLEEKIRLSSLHIDSYILKDRTNFHQALVHQQSSLRHLFLSGDTDEMFRDHLDTLVDSLKQLKQLQTLTLILPEIFREEHLITLFTHLVLLEELYVSGLELRDNILDSLAGMKHLRNVTLSGISKFTTDGLLEFVSRLGPGNSGIRVHIDMADPETFLGDGDQRLIKDCLKEKIGGSLEYMLFRDPNISDFEGDYD
ncbi:hypothetical protein NX059_006127 [Plenodomus lindquistii]|nr:hypothetical protein NX059_006127 [Plenodomus lindquistii]